MINRFRKQPSEIFTITVDFVDCLLSGETIASKEVTATRGATDYTSTVIGSSSTVGNTVEILVKAGVDKKTYKITTKVTTSLNNVFEEDIYMTVREL